MKKAIWVLIVVVILGLITLLISKGNTQKTEKILKIGAPLILSGDFAKYGESSKNAIEIALDEYNSKLEVQNKEWPRVEAIYEDTRADPKTAVSAYQKLASFDKVDLIVGPLLQAEMSAIAPLVEKDKIPVFSVAPIPFDQRGNVSNPLVIWPDPTLEAEQMAEYTYNQGTRSIGILSTRDAWESEVSEAFKKKFIELGGKVTAHEIVLPDSKDTSLPVTKVIATHPDSVFVGTYYKFIYFVKKLKELGFKGKLYSIEIDTYLAGETKLYSNNLQFISPAFYTPEFVATYKAKYAEEPSIPSGQAHDAMGLLLSLVPKTYSEDTNLFKQNMLKEMAKLTEYNGVSGKIVFSAEHRATFPLNIFEINDGVIKKIK